MRDGLKVFDADAHVIYPADLWPRFLDARFRDRVGRRSPPGFDHYNPVTVDGRWSQHHDVDLRQLPEGHQLDDRGHDRQVRRGHGARRASPATASRTRSRVEGVDVMVIYGPEYDMWLEGIDPELQAAMARAYNRWGAEMREAVGRARHHVAARSRSTTSAARSRRSSTRTTSSASAASGRGPNQFNHRNLGDRYYDPVYELLQDLDCAFATHEYMGLNAPTAGSDRFYTFTEWHTVVHSHEAQYAIAVDDRATASTSGSRACAARTWRRAAAGCRRGCTASTSTSSSRARQEFPDLTMNATEYFKRNCWISTECEDPFVADVIRWLGDDHIVFETDFPHPDSKYPHATDHFLDLLPTIISEESKRKILWDNAVDLYRFPDGYLP